MTPLKHKHDHVPWTCTNIPSTICARGYIIFLHEQGKANYNHGITTCIGMIKNPKNIAQYILHESFLKMVTMKMANTPEKCIRSCSQTNIYEVGTCKEKHTSTSKCR